MATNTAQYEATALKDASRDLELALMELDVQIQEYEKFGAELAEDMKDYRNTRRRWLI